MQMGRRTVLRGAGALAALGALPGTFGIRIAHAALAFDLNESFTAGHVRRLAEQLSRQDFVKPSIPLPEAYRQIGYDRYRDIRFRTDQAIWRGERRDFELQLLPMGWLYEVPVEIWLVEGLQARRVAVDKSLFSFGPLVGDVGNGAPYGFSGFRVHGPINRPDYFDECVVFQGASYFRAVGRRQTHGLSARGLTIDTARPGGEEFPIFRSFWIEKPEQGQRTLTVHALLDSRSTTGAYKLVIEPGASTIIDVQATLFPRRVLTHVGLGALTSMFLHGPGHHRIENDFRPAVHDSDGLAILNGNGECIWRPLTNPRTLQASAFMDRSPRGFGLCQRARDFRDFEDLEARYERRPSVWIEPKGRWGQGYVELIEIPTSEEIHDNIVAYWKPAKGPEPGTPFTFGYRMYWGDDVPIAWSGAKVVGTRVGNGPRDGTFLFVVDFAGPAVAGQKERPIAMVTSNPGTIANVSVHENPEIEGTRVSFELDPRGSELCELRMALSLGDRQISESWLYRWTKA